jgi:beta-aspartyl-dipeptidase (metallo-type)
MLTLIESGELYAPQPLGRGDVLLVGGRIARVGTVDRDAAERLGIGLETIDARGCLVTPGLIDPHEHLLGGSGESGFASQTPEISLSEIVTAGITTVVGTLGVDTTMKTLPGLLAKVKALREEGLSAYMWTGGYNIPPTTITATVRDDILFVDEVIGCGEVAIADERSTEPSPDELARVVHDAYVGGMLARKAGVTHFHVGSGERRLQCLRDLLDQGRSRVDPGWLYPTHVGRNEALLDEAVDLARRGATVDVDMVDGGMGYWLRCYLEHGGDPERLTFSSDASITSPRSLFAQFQDAVLREGFTPEQVLPHLTVNTARALRLESKGRIEPGCDADVLVLERGSLELREVLAGGRRMVKGGRPAVVERFLQDSDRRITLHGQKQ